MHWGTGFKNVQWHRPTVPDSQRNQEPLNDLQLGWDVVHCLHTHPNNMVEDMETK